jgi:hypothetical protein
MPDLLQQLVRILQNHCGETDDNEGAVDTLRRIIAERDRERYARERIRRDTLQGVEAMCRDYAGRAGGQASLAADDIADRVRGLWDKGGGDG